MSHATHQIMLNKQVLKKAASFKPIIYLTFQEVLKCVN